MGTLMDYSVFFQQTFEKLGFDVVGVWNVFDGEYDWQSGWQCQLPAVNFTPTTVLILYLQDRVTVVNGHVLELEKIIQQYGEIANKLWLFICIQDWMKFIQDQ